MALDTFPRTTKLTGKNRQHVNTELIEKVPSIVAYGATVAAEPGSTSVTPNMPSGTQVGDTMVIVLFWGGGGGLPTAPSGWTSLGGSASGGTTGIGGTQNGYVSWKRDYQTSDTMPTITIASAARGIRAGSVTFRPYYSGNLCVVATAVVGTGTSGLTSLTDSNPAPNISTSYRVVRYAGWFATASAVPAATTARPSQTLASLQSSGIRSIGSAGPSDSFSAVSGGTALCAQPDTVDFDSIGQSGTWSWATTQIGSTYAVYVRESYSPSNSVLVAPGFFATSGAWVQLFSSTPTPFGILKLEVDLSSYTFSASSRFAAEIGIGAASSEVVVARQDFSFVAGVSTANIPLDILYPFPSGSRISIRIQSLAKTPKYAATNPSPVYAMVTD